MKKGYPRRRSLNGHVRVQTQLAVARREVGVTQEELAQRLSVTQSAIAQVERPDGNPTLYTIERIASALGWRLSIEPMKQARPTSSSER